MERISTWIDLFRYNVIDQQVTQIEPVKAPQSANRTDNKHGQKVRVMRVLKMRLLDRMVDHVG